MSHTEQKYLIACVFCVRWVMPTVSLAYLLSVLLAVTPVFSQIGESTVLPKKNSAPEDTTESPARLPIVNPLFAPYQGQWYVEVDATEQRSAFTATIPAQTYSGFGISESKSRSDYTDIRVGGRVSYGIHDRLMIGIRTHFLADRQVQTSSSGAFNSVGGGLSNKTGMYNPDLALQGRLLGVNRDEWHMNIIAIYSPGAVGGLSTPQSNVRAGLLLGRNAGYFTFGVVGFAIWSPETTSGTIRYRSTTAVSGETILQAHFTPFFVNVLAGAFQYVDPGLANDAMSGKTRVVWAAELGAEIQQNAFVKISYGWLMPISADYNSNGLQMTFRDHGGPAASLIIGARF